MIVHLDVSMEGMAVKESFTGANAEEVVGKMKARVARELNFVMKLALNAMTNLAFAQEVVRRYNEAHKQNLPLPNSCQEFLTRAQEQGFATIEP